MIKIENLNKIFNENTKREFHALKNINLEIKNSSCVILKAVGWSIKDIIKLKIIENFIVGFMAFIIGVVFAYIFVFIFNAPILRNIFIGFSNVQNDFILNANIEFSTLITLFLFFIIPFLSAVLIPVWKIAVIDANESMK